MSAPGYPGDPSLPPSSGADPDFEPAESFGRPTSDGKPKCICPGLSDDPNCPRHGKEN